MGKIGIGEKEISWKIISMAAAVGRPNQTFLEKRNSLEGENQNITNVCMQVLDNN